MVPHIIFLFFIIVSLKIIYMYKFKCKTKKLRSAKTLIVIGSGGHTLEMLSLVKKLDPKLFIPRLYVMANEDASSEYKITQVEKEFAVTKSNDYEIYKIPRSRYVNQSYLTSLFTTMFSLIKSIPIVIRFKPDLILCNGPGTCVPICLIAFLTNIFLFFKTKIVFIESICRVKTLSLSGKILIFVADVVIVQWSSLHKKYPQTIFLGRLF